MTLGGSNVRQHSSQMVYAEHFSSNDIECDYNDYVDNDGIVEQEDVDDYKG